MKTPTPKHRAVIHLAADMRKGAGAHYVARKDGPSMEEWEEEDMQNAFADPYFDEYHCDGCVICTQRRDP